MDVFFVVVYFVLLVGGVFCFDVMVVVIFMEWSLVWLLEIMLFVLFRVFGSIYYIVNEFIV